MIEVWASSLSTVKVRHHRTVFETFSPGSYFSVQLIDYIEWATAKFRPPLARDISSRANHYDVEGNRPCTWLSKAKKGG